MRVTAKKGINMIDTTMIRLITGATTHLGDSAKDAFIVCLIRRIDELIANSKKEK